MDNTINKRGNLIAFAFTVIVFTSITVAIAITNIFVFLIYSLVYENLSTFFIIFIVLIFGFLIQRKLIEKTKNNNTKEAQFNILFQIMVIFTILILYLIFGEITFLLLGFSFALSIVFLFYTWERRVIKLVLKHNDKVNSHFLQNQMIVYIIIVNIITALFFSLSNIEKYIINLINFDLQNVNIVLILSFTTLLIFEFFHKKNPISFEKNSLNS